MSIEEIKKDPYNYIISHYENLYHHIGGKVWSLISLMPVSLIIPKIPRNGKGIKQKISCLILAPPGYGKTSIAELFEKITYNPIFTERVTLSRLNHEIRKLCKGDDDLELVIPRLSLIVSDVATIFMDENLIKFVEGILGEEGTISNATMRNKNDKMKQEVDGIGFFSGTPENISDNRIQRGLLARVSPLLIFHSEEEHEEIIDSVNKGIGNDSQEEQTDIIKNYYQELLDIQEGRHKEINPIEGYIIDEDLKMEIREYIKPLVKKIFSKYGIAMVRELEETYRFTIAHSFLNIFNREIKNNKLVITREDVEVAKGLIKREIHTKAMIMKCIEQLDYFNIKTRDQLREWEKRYREREKKDIPQSTKFIMEGLVN